MRAGTLPMKLGLKVDVSTLRGARDGVPRLITLLQRHGAGATFFFCVGPDHSRFGRLMPGPDLGRRAGDTMRAARDAGFETGVQAYDARRWREHVARADVAWTEAQMQRAVDRYAEIFHDYPRAHAAAGWQTNAHALRMTQRLGFDYCSDGQGRAPHLPVRNAELIRCPQFPTTLPTLDELAGEGIPDRDSAMRVLERTATHPASMAVFTLRADRDGGARLALVEQLLAGWQAQGHELVALRSLYESVEPLQLPRCTVTLDSTTGRAGRCLVQGDEFLGEPAHLA